MQAGTTGINTMRVYNVTKQGKDQDPNGVFIRKYVPELKNVPNEYIHEPHKMPVKLQKKYCIQIGNNQSTKSSDGFIGFVKQTSMNPIDSKSTECTCYPYPIVDEKSSAKASKDKLSAVRKQESTKKEAQAVYLKHGSRRTHMEDRNGAAPKTLSGSAKRKKIDDGQMSIMNIWKQSHEISLGQMNGEEDSNAYDEDSVIDVTDECTQEMPTPHKTSTCTNGSLSAEKLPSKSELYTLWNQINTPPQKSSTIPRQLIQQTQNLDDRDANKKQSSLDFSFSPRKQKGIASFFVKKVHHSNRSANKTEVDCRPIKESVWDCEACTYRNEKPLALACSMCGSFRS
jgi:hypothetical protein